MLQAKALERAARTNGNWAAVASSYRKAVGYAEDDTAARKGLARAEEEQQYRSKVKAFGEMSSGLAMTNSIKMSLVLITPEEFMMGSRNGEADERPVHVFPIPKCSVSLDLGRIVPERIYCRHGQCSRLPSESDCSRVAAAVYGCLACCPDEQRETQ